MILKIVVYGLCVVKESTGAGDPHVIIPVKGSGLHRFTLRGRNSSVVPGDFLGGFTETEGEKWSCRIPDDTELKIGTEPRRARRPPAGGIVPPATLGDLGLEGLGDEERIRQGSFGTFSLPSNAGGFGWVGKLGDFSLGCKSRERPWPVAHLFVWTGDFEADEVEIEVTSGRVPREPLKVIRGKGPEQVTLEARCEEPDEYGTTFGYWHYYHKVARAESTLNQDCRPTAAGELFHPNSPSCPPVKG